MVFSISEKSGFFCGDEVVRICTTSPRLKTFYLKQNPKRELYFNLPEGEYTTDNDLEQLERPLTYHTPELPEPERNVKEPKELTIIIEANPNKCSVAKKKGLIIIDPQLTKEPKPFLTFILFHEIGHYDYKTEWKCDLFSAKKMLEKGYNPSQCMYAQHVSLSEKQQDRKDILKEFLTETTYTL